MLSCDISFTRLTCLQVCNLPVIFCKLFLEGRAYNCETLGKNKKLTWAIVESQAAQVIETATEAHWLSALSGLFFLTESHRNQRVRRRKIQTIKLIFSVLPEIGASLILLV